MSDDFNYAEALGFLFEINKLVHVSQSGGSVLKELGQLLGLFYSGLDEDGVSPEIQSLIDERSAAKKAKDFAKADGIRKRLEEDYGILLKDTPAGVTWVRV
jgi:cysteinyl-tRNA synthetase